jgi:uncharacterized protein with beta-barrel porin domain
MAQNTYTGATDITGGVLAVNGSIASSSLTTVHNGGTPTGSGTVGNTIVNSGGLFAPGNGTAGSSTAVSGNLAFQSGATICCRSARLRLHSQMSRARPPWAAPR